MGRGHYAPAVNNGILRGQRLIWLGRGVPMVIPMVTQDVSQEIAGLNDGKPLKGGEFDGLRNVINFTGN